MEVFKLSVPPILKLWQELQEIKPDLDKRVSKYSFLPNSTIDGFLGATASIGLIISLRTVEVVAVFASSAVTALAQILTPIPAAASAALISFNFIVCSYCFT